MKQQPIGVPLSRHEGRLAGHLVLKGTQFHPTCVMMDQAHLTVLHHTTLLSAYEDEHLEFIKNRDHRKKPLTRTLNNVHNKEYIGWLKDRLENGSSDDIVTWLAQKPSPTIVKYQAYDINGNTFYTKDRDQRTTYHNSSVRIESLSAGKDPKKEVYYGTIQEIWELD